MSDDFDSLSDEDVKVLFNDGTLPNKTLLSIDGVAETTATSFNNGLAVFFNIIENSPFPISYVKTMLFLRTIPNQYALQDSEIKNGKKDYPKKGTRSFQEYQRTRPSL